MSDPKPNIPSIRQAVDLIWRMWIDGCDAPVTVWMEKFWPAFGELILAWYTIDLMNIFTSFMRPGSSGYRDRSSRHMGGGKKGRRKGGLGALGRAINFDPGEFIGNKLPGADDLHARPVTPGVMMMWGIYGVIERLLWYFMVIDLTGDFLYRWASSVVEAGYCGAREDAVLYAKTPEFEQIGIVGWWPVIYAETLKARRLTFWNGVGVNQITGPGIVSFAATGECLETGGGPGTIGIRLRCLNGPSVDTIYQATETVEVGAEMGLICGGACAPGDLWITEVAVDGRFLVKDSEFLLHAAWVPYT